MSPKNYFKKMFTIAKRYCESQWVKGLKSGGPSNFEDDPIVWSGKAGQQN